MPKVLHAEGSGTQTLDRGLLLTKLIMESGAQGMRMSEIVEATGINKSTVHRLLLQLWSHGWLSRDIERRYRLGRVAYEMGIVASAQFDVRDLCSAAMDRLAEETSDTIFLAARTGASSYCIDFRIGLDVRPPVVPPRGFVQPLGVGAAGTALLSSLSDSQIDAVIRYNEKRFASYHGLSPNAVSGSVAETRRAGFSKLGNYVAKGVVAVGMCVSDHAGRPLFALSAATTCSRMSSYHQRCSLDALRAEAERMKLRLSQNGLPPAMLLQQIELPN